MLMNLVYVMVGLLGLFYGGHWLVKGAARLASSYQVSPLLIGLTVVAFGTSMPELLVNVNAARHGSAELSLGNIIGSNVANVALILGVTGLFFPFVVDTRLARRELPIMIVVSMLVLLLASDGELSRLDGLLMVGGMVAFTAISYRWATQEKRRLQAEMLEFERAEDLIEINPANRGKDALILGTGLVVLIIGANVLVRGAVAMAREVGVSELVIGITLVAIGTSFPELSASLIAGMRGENDIAVGNVIGSNITNLLAILGMTTLIQPLRVDAQILRFEFPVMIGFAVLLWPFALNEWLGRWAAGLFVAGYVAFMVVAVVR